MRLPRLLILAALLCAAKPAHAQFLDPDNQIGCWSCYGHRYHFMAGAVIDLAMRPAPFFAKSWRSTAVGRVGTVLALGTLYELNNYFGICAPPSNNWHCGVGGRGFSLLGLSYDLAGAGVAEFFMSWCQRSDSREGRVVRRNWIVAMLGLVGLLVGRPGQAQVLDPDNKLMCWSCPSHNDHFIVSGIFDLAVRPMPFLAKSWRQHPLGRIGLVVIGGTIYELNDMRQCLAYNPPCGSEVGRGFGLVDIVWDAAGAAAVELTQAVIEKALHLHF